MSYEVPKFISILVEDRSTKKECNSLLLRCIFMTKFELFNITILQEGEIRRKQRVRRSEHMRARQNTISRRAYLMFIKEVAALSDDMRDKEPAASLHRLSVPKDEWVGKHDHSYRRPKVTKLVHWMIMRNLNVDVFVTHDLIIKQPQVIFGEADSKIDVKLEFGRRCGRLEVPIALHLCCCRYKLSLKDLEVVSRNISI